MNQAVATPGFGLPHGTALIQPQVAGEIAIASVKIGARKDIGYDDQLTAIASRLETLAQTQVAAKSQVELRWIEGLKAYHGIYDKSFIDPLKNAKQATAFVKATRAKALALEARLFDLIFPTDDRNWGIQPTPVPKLSRELKEAQMQAQSAADAANQAEAAGNQDHAQQAVADGHDQAARASAASEEIAASEKAADLMQEEMEDQLVESKYPSECRKLISNACRLGSGILKGPMVNESKRGRWIPTEAGEHALTPNDDPRPLMRWVDPWSFFPEMSATCIEEAEFTFERYLWSRSQLRKMVDKMGFDPEAVRELLKETRQGRPATSPSLANLVTLRSITDSSAGQIKDRYIGWEYHGPLELDEICAILRAMGREQEAEQYAAEDDPLQELRVIVHFCEGVILKISPEYPLDSGDTLYSLFNLEEAEGSMFGYGIPHIVGDQQSALNSTWRMALDNAALSTGPQTIVDKTEIEPQDGSWKMVARKVWLRVKAQTVSGARPPVEFFNIPNNMQQLGSLIQLCENFIDMESGIPQPQQGEQGTHTTQTVGGMAILQTAANIIFRRVVKNFDDGIIAPTMRRLYDWNMQFNAKKEIKGDMQIDARGTSVLLLKEVQASNLMLTVTQLMSNPNLAPMLKPYSLVQKLFQAMMIKPDEVMIEQDKYDEMMKQMQSQPPPPSAPEINAKARVDTAQIQATASQSSDQTDLQIAAMKERTALYALAQTGQISMAEVKAEIAKTQMTLDSAERRMVSEAALEQQIAERDHSMGLVPTGSGGDFSAGAKPA